MVHCDLGFPTAIGRNVTVGHNAVIHGCTIGDDCVIGMHSVVMNGAVIGQGSVVAGGAVIPEGKEYPPNSLIVGAPGRVVKDVTPEMRERFIHGAIHYQELAKRYLAMGIGIPQMPAPAV